MTWDADFRGYSQIKVSGYWIMTSLLSQKIIKDQNDQSFRPKSAQTGIIGDKSICLFIYRCRKEQGIRGPEFVFGTEARGFPGDGVIRRL